MSIPVPKNMHKTMPMPMPHMPPMPMPPQATTQQPQPTTQQGQVSKDIGNSNIPVSVSAEYKTGTTASATCDSHSASVVFDNSTTASASMTIGNNNASSTLGVSAKTGIVASASGGLDGTNVYANASYSDTTEIHATGEVQGNYKGVGTSVGVDAYAKTGTEMEAHVLAGSKGIDAGGSVSTGSYVGVNASNTTNLREASVTTSAGVSFGEHFEAGGSGQATFVDGKATVGVSGDLAAFVGVNADVSVTVDTKQIQKDAVVVSNAVSNAVAKEAVKLTNDPTVKKAESTVVNTATKVGNDAGNTAKKAGNDINKGLKKIHF